MTALSTCLSLALLIPLASGEAPDAALKQLEQRCTEGSATACFEAGLAHDQGTSEDAAVRAAERYQRACDGGDMRGCNSAGVCHRRGHGVTRNVTKALSLTRRACDAKLAVGCFNLGAMLAEGDGLPKEPTAAVVLFERACTADYGPACTAAGATTLNLSNAISAAQAAKAQTYFNRGCALRDGEGCYNLGQLSRQLDGPTAGALYAYRQACTFGVPAGCSWQGLMLHRGEGSASGSPTKRAQKKGVRLMTRACEDGFHEGCFNAAIAYVKGDGVRKDHQAAGRLFTQACRGGVAQACALLERQKRRKGTR